MGRDQRIIWHNILTIVKNGCLGKNITKTNEDTENMRNLHTILQSINE